MKLTHTSLSTRLRALLVAAIPLVAAQSAFSLDGSVQAMFGRSTAAVTAGEQLGATSRSTATSSKWIVIGAPFSRDRGVTWEGAVQVFNAATRAWVRQIQPPVGANVNLYFGSSVAISGDLALIGAFGGDSSRGRAYLYNLATGALIRTLVAADGVAGAQFGIDVAIEGNKLIVSADGDNSARGAVYVFDLTTGGQLAKIVFGFPIPNDRLGISIAAEGQILAVGLQGYNGNRGAVAFYDLNTFAFIKLYTPAGVAAGTYAGKTLSMHEGRVLVGAYGKAYLYNLRTDAGLALAVPVASAYFADTVSISGPLMAVGDKEIWSGQGRVHFYDSVDGAYIDSIAAPNGDIDAQNFGKSICLRDQTLVVTAPAKNTRGGGPNNGVAYHFNLALQEMGFSKVVAKGDFAPGLLNTNYSQTGEAFVGPTGKTAFTTTLSVNGAAPSSSAVSTDVATLGSQFLYANSAYELGTGSLIGSGVKTKSVSRLALNDSSYLIGTSILTGTGVTSANNLMLWVKGRVTDFPYLRTGYFSADLGGILQTLPEWVTSNMEGGYFASIFTLRPDSARAVSAINDSGAFSAKFFSPFESDYESIRENSAAPVSLPAGTLYGQFAPRIADYRTMQAFSTALTGPGITAANNAAVFRRVRGNFATVVAQKGTEARNMSGAVITDVRFTSFIGESTDHMDNVVYRAAISGPDVRSTNNEGIWIRYGASSDQVLAVSKGMTVVAAGGAYVAKIINFWGAGNDGLTPKVMSLVQLGGTGVNSSNDQALVLRTLTSIPTVLIREGDAAPGCAGAKISVINRVEFDAESGSYAVLATLSGAPVGTELALFTGNVNRGNFAEQAALRRPYLALRKGQLWDNQPSPIKSISLPTSNLTASGAGGTGRGRAISRNSEFVFTVEFTNGVRQIMKGSAL